MTQRDLTAAMNDLQVVGFSDWETTFETGDPAGASMTQNAVSITTAFNTLAALMKTYSSSTSALVATVGADLSDTGADFDDLISGEGTMADQAAIVHDLSSAVAAAVRICGPSPLTRYAPAQEAAIDDLGAVGTDYSSYSQSLTSDISQTNADLHQEERLNALGPEGHGGSCTVALQMGQAAQEIGQGDAGSFSQNLQDLTGDVSGTQQSVSSLQSDLGEIQAQGLVPPAGVPAAIANANQSINSAIATGNHDIDQQDALVSQAFALAEAMADIPSTSTSNGSFSGSCEGDGPGQVGPFLIRHIS